MDKSVIRVGRHVTDDYLMQEGIKTLRANLMFTGRDKCVFGLTSCNADEGKSTTSLQLAVSFAQLNKRVLLLGVDLRKSALAMKFGLAKTKKGVSHYLSGMAQLDEIIHRTDVPGLQIAYAGKLVPHASELLSSQAFHELIQAVRREYDYVIVDNPPLGQVIDCAVIASELDGIVILIDATNNSYRLERRIIEQIEKADGRVLGVVLNRVDFSGKFGYYGKMQVESMPINDVVTALFLKIRFSVNAVCLRDNRIGRKICLETKC